MTTILSLVNRLFDVMFIPFDSLDPLYGLTAVSVVTGILMLIIYRYTSNQVGIKKVKERIKAHLLAVRLFQDQFGVVVRTHGQMLGSIFSYIGYSLKPLAVMLLPIIVIMVQLEMRLGQHPARPGESFLVDATLAAEAELEQVSLRLPPELYLTAPPLRIPDQNQMTWRVAAREEGEFKVEVLVGERTFNKTVSVADSSVRLSSSRLRASLLNQFLYPGEAPLPTDAPVESIEVKYRPRSIDCVFFKSHWLIPFFGLSLIAGLALKGTLGTEI